MSTRVARAAPRSVRPQFIDVIHFAAPSLSRRASMRRAYHDTGVSGGVAPDQGVGPRKRAAAKVRERAESAMEEEEATPSFVEDLVAFLEDEFWVLFFAMLYALSVVFFLLACAHKYFGSRKRVWTYVIVAFVPWTIGTTMWLIDPRWEQWTLDAVKKSYFRWQELRHRPKAMWEAVERWWRWRRAYKPARVHGV